MTDRKSKYTLDTARQVVSRCAGTVIAGKKISVTAGAVGIKVYGAIDYLCSKEGFTCEIQKAK